MEELIQLIKETFNLNEEESFQRGLKYYHLDGCKFVTFYDKPIAKKDIMKVLGEIGRDGKSYPMSQNFMVLVIGETDDEFVKTDGLEWMRGNGENAVFVLYNKRLNKLFYPTSIVLPLRYSYRRITKKINSLFEQIKSAS